MGSETDDEADDEACLETSLEDVGTLVTNSGVIIEVLVSSVNVTAQLTVVLVLVEVKQVVVVVVSKPFLLVDITEHRTVLGKKAWVEAEVQEPAVLVVRPCSSTPIIIVVVAVVAATVFVILVIVIWIFVCILGTGRSYTGRCRQLIATAINHTWDINTARYTGKVKISSFILYPR